MSLTSATFLIYVVALMAVYFAFPVKKYQWVVLLVGSYFFYCYGGWKFPLYMMITTVSVWYAGCLIGKRTAETKKIVKEHKEDWSKDERKAFKAKAEKSNRIIIFLAVLLNFGILAFFKYYNFFAQVADLPMMELVLPLGISFYTFQSIGYLVDVYRGDAEYEKNVFKFALFVAFFPQIIQGPISKHSQLAHQLYEEHKPEWVRFKYGLELLLWGLFKKLVIADRASATIAMAGAYETLCGTTLLFITLLYAVQLYADFSAGIDIIRAIAQMLGIDMIQNFRQPYFSTSLTDYWNRWHISLGAWMKNYIFYPLALSGLASKMTNVLSNSAFGRTKAGSHIAKTLPGALASMIVFIVVGMWHGSGDKYLWFGIWNGFIIMLGILLKPCMDWLNIVLHINVDGKLHRHFRIFRTWIFVGIGYIFDLVPNASAALVTMRKIVTNQSIGDFIYQMRYSIPLNIYDCVNIALGTVILFVVGIVRERSGENTLRVKLGQKKTYVQWLVVFAGCLALLLMGRYGPGYTPGEFAYAQF